MTENEGFSFLGVEDVLIIHDLQLRRFGGGAGIRDFSMLESALGRVESVYIYDESSDAVRLAATLCHAIVANHPFVDGNKRTGYGAMSTFLALNGLTFETHPIDAANQVLGLASGRASLAEVEEWLRAKVVPDTTYSELMEYDRAEEPPGLEGP